MHAMLSHFETPNIFITDKFTQLSRDLISHEEGAEASKAYVNIGIQNDLINWTQTSTFTPKINSVKHPVIFTFDMVIVTFEVLRRNNTNS